MGMKSQRGNFPRPGRALIAEKQTYSRSGFAAGSRARFRISRGQPMGDSALFEERRFPGAVRDYRCSFASGRHHESFTFQKQIMLYKKTPPAESARGVSFIVFFKKPITNRNIGRRFALHPSAPVPQEQREIIFNMNEGQPLLGVIRRVACILLRKNACPRHCRFSPDASFISLPF